MELTGLYVDIAGAVDAIYRRQSLMCVKTRLLAKKTNTDLNKLHVTFHVLFFFS